MKKNLSVFFIFFTLFFDFSFITAQEKTFTNDQKIWSVDCEEIKILRYLFIATGHALPSSTGPWNTDEMKLMLSKLDGEEALNTEFLNSLYDKVYSSLYKNPKFILENDLAIDLNLAANPEIYVHTNKTDFTSETDWAKGFEERADFLDIDFSFLFAKHFYIDLKLPLQYVPFDSFYTPQFMSNFPGITPENLSLISINFPTRAIMAFGGNHWSFSFGRDKIRFGNGESGNLTLGGNQIYDNHIRFATFFDKFKFSAVAIFYPHYYPESEEEEKLNQNDVISGLKMYLNHRLEGRFFSDRLDVILSESIMYQSADGSLDVSVFNPAGIFHNYYIRGNANSIMNIDVDFAITKRLNLYGQVAIDDLVVPGDTTSSSAWWRPNKMGFLLGIKGIQPIFNGFLTFVAEGVYTDPYLYLREKYNSTTGQYGVSFYGDLRYFNSKNGYEIHYLNQCLGYKYGGDCITGTLKAKYQDKNNWYCSAEVFYMAHGIMTVNYLNKDQITGKADLSPSTEDKTGTVTDKDSVQHLFRASFEGGYQLYSWLSFYASADNIFVWNKGNVTKDMVYDLQFCLGSKITW